MTASDLDRASAISDAVHGRFTEPRQVYAERLALYPAGCFVLEGGGGIAGYLIAHPWRHQAPPTLGALIGSLPATPDSFYLHDLALLPAARGSGAGAAGTHLALDLAAKEELPSVFLLAVNGAETFWASRGFAKVTDAAVAAQYGDDVVYMRRVV